MQLNSTFGFTNESPAILWKRLKRIQENSIVEMELNFTSFNALL